MLKINHIKEGHFELSDRFIEEFIKRYGDQISIFVSENVDDTALIRKTISWVILEVYYRINYGLYDLTADNTHLINTLSFKVLSELLAQNNAVDTLNINSVILNPEKCKLFLNSENFKSNAIAKALKEIGEPGRTALKLSFFNKVEENEIVKYIQADSSEQMNKKRLRFLDKCLNLLESDG